MNINFFIILIILIGFFAGYKTFRNPDVWGKPYGFLSSDIKRLSVKWTKVFGVFMMIFFAVIFLLLLIKSFN